MIAAVKKMQNKDLDATVITNDSWDLFMLDMDGTKWEYLTQMKESVMRLKEINTKNLAPRNGRSFIAAAFRTDCDGCDV